MQALDGGPFTTVDSTSHGMEPILRVHNPELVDFLSTAWKDYITILPDAQAVIAEMFIHPGLVEAMPVGRPPVSNAYGRLGWFCFDTSSPLSEGSWPAALSSVDIALSGVDRLLAGERIVYSLCRPPGHHATRSAFGGFCLLNNAAIAAQALIDSGVRRVTVLDVDAHHGNGTQQIFYQRGDVQFVSIHMDPDQNYPWFVGRAHERGEGAGAGRQPQPAIAARHDGRSLTRPTLRSASMRWPHSIPSTWSCRLVSIPPTATRPQGCA